MYKEKIVVVQRALLRKMTPDTKEKILSVSGETQGERNVENFIKFVISLKNWVKGRRFFEISWRLTKEAAGRRRRDSRKPDWPYNLPRIVCFYTTEDLSYESRAMHHLNI